MNLCIDQGNTQTKVAIFDDYQLIEKFFFDTSEPSEIEEIIVKFNPSHCILSTVRENHHDLSELLKKRVSSFIMLTEKTRIPISSNYTSPTTLGKDRLAAVIGASYLQPYHDLLVIDAGTAITYDFINSKNIFIGGNIAPGINMRLRALHEFTSKLPLIEAKAESQLLGVNTEMALNSGAIYGIQFEIDGYIDALKIKYPKLSTFLTGGSAFYFHTNLKNAIFVEPNLVLIGLNRILQYNLNK
jgi:type III pantothenate kinase